MKSEDGPWKQFQMIRPYGIRNMQTGEYYNFEKKIEAPPNCVAVDLANTKTRHEIVDNGKTNS